MSEKAPRVRRPTARAQLRELDPEAAQAARIARPGARAARATPDPLPAIPEPERESQPELERESEPELDDELVGERVSGELDSLAPSLSGSQPETIVITGICGRMGRLVARRLHREHPVIGIDQIGRAHV